MPRTAAEEQEFQELHKIYGNQESPAKKGRTPEEEQEFQVLKARFDPDPTEGNGWLARGATALGASPDVANTVEDITNLPKRVSKGAVQGLTGLADVVAYPVRKAMEGVSGSEIPTLSSQIPEMAPAKTPVGRIAHKAAEFGGEAIGMAPWGRAFGAAAAAIPRTTLPLKAASKTLSGTSKVIGNPANAAEMAQFGALSGGLGAASGTLQEMGANPLVADIASAVGLGVASVGRALYKLGRNPAALTSAEKGVVTELTNKLGPEGLQDILGQLEKAPAPELAGYTPTTAEAIGSSPLAQMERAYGSGQIGALPNAQQHGTNVLEKELGKLQPPNADIGATQQHFGMQKEALEKGATKAAEKASAQVAKQVDPYLGKETREVTGEKLQGIAGRFLEKFKGERQQASAPLYDAVRASEEGIHTPEAKSYIKNLIEKEGIVGPQKAKVERLGAAIESNSATKETKQLYSQLQKEFGGVTPDAMENILKQLGIGDVLPKAAQLDQTLSLIGEEIAIAKRAGKHSTARNLTGLKQALERDVAKVAPEVGQARAMYAKKSIPVREITHGKGLKQAVEQDIYNTQHKVGAAQLPDLFLRGTKAVENSRNLMKLIARDPGSKALMKQYVYEDFIRHVTDANGNVHLGKIDSYLKKNPAASIIDPRFKTNVMKIANAQKGVEQTKGSLKKNAYLGKEEQAYKAILGKDFQGLDAHNVIKSVFEGTNKATKMSGIVNIAKNKKESLEGLKKAAIEHLFHNTNIKSPGSRNMTFWREHRGALTKLFSPQEMQVIDQIGNVLKARAKVLEMGATRNSSTKANFSVAAETKKKIMAKAFHGLTGMLNKIPGTRGVVGTALEGAAEAVTKQANADLTKGVEEFLAHPDYAKSLLSRSSNKAAHKAAHRTARKEATFKALKQPWLVHSSQEAK